MRNIILIASIVFSIEAFGGVLFSDDFEGDLSAWVGKSGGAHNGAIVSDPLEADHALTFRQLIAAGDIFSGAAFSSGSGDYVPSYDYLDTCSPVPVGGCGGFIGHSLGKSLSTWKPRQLCRGFFLEKFLARQHPAPASDLIPGVGAVLGSFYTQETCSTKPAASGVPMHDSTPEGDVMQWVCDFSGLKGERRNEAQFTLVSAGCRGLGPDIIRCYGDRARTGGQGVLHRYRGLHRQVS